MAKAKKNTSKAKTTEEKMNVSERINQSILEKLKEKKKELIQEEEIQKVKEIERKSRERREREKNKSFEELLNESELTWKDFK